VEFQQLRYVVAVAEDRSFTRAAKRCFVVQSALSHQIKALETELGVPLFARTSRRVELTEAGEAFLHHARASLDAAERAVASAAAVTGEVRGTLTIGVIPTVTAIDLPAVLGEFHRAYPAVRIKVRTGASDEFVAAIGEGSVDVAVLGLPESTPPIGVAKRILAREHLMAVVGAQHRLAHRRRLRLPDLADETFVDFPVNSPGRAQSDLAFHAAGIRRDVTFETTNIGLMLGLVRQNLAVTLLPAAMVPASSDLRTIPVVDGPTRIQYLAWSDFNPSPATRAFLAAVPVA
jgi:DNA-binding transcriptional LysR family regulator